MTNSITKEERLAGARKALLNYQQADQDGIMVITSRQAIHEVDDALTALEEERDALRTALHAAEIMAEIAATEVGSRLAALEEENARLREALKPFAEEAFRYEPDENDGFFNAWDSTFSIGDLRRARKAFNGE